MNLDNIQYCDLPFKHWEFKNCTDDLTLKEISNCSIPITKDNATHFPYLTKLINKMQSYEFFIKMSSILKKDLSNSYVRLEIIGDKKGFWLKPHKDIPEKLMSMLIWANPYKESKNLGTDLYNDEFEIVKTIKYVHNAGYFFSSGQDTWHGLELKEIKKERRCIQINYVSFKTDWPVENL